MVLHPIPTAMVVPRTPKTVKFGMSTITVDNTIRGRPLMIWAGMVDSVAENLVTSSVFGVSFTVTHKLPLPRL